MKLPDVSNGFLARVAGRFRRLPSFRRKVVASGALLASFLVATVLMATRVEPQPQERREKAWPVSTMPADLRTQSPSLVVYGKVESNQVANLKTTVSAAVASVLTPEGSFVEKGALMLALDKSELQLAVEVARARYERQLAQLKSAETARALAVGLTRHEQELADIAQAKLARHQDLYRQGMVSDAILDEVRQQASQRSIALEQHLAKIRDFPNVIDQTRAQVAESRALLQKALLDLEQTELRAPFTGRVIDTLVAPGDRALPGTPLIRFAGHEGIEIRATIPAATGARLRDELRRGGRITAQSVLDGEHVTFALDRLSGDVKAGQTGLDGFFRVTDSRVLDIGRVVGLNIVLPEVAQTVALPIQSIYDGDRVYRVENRRLVAIDVERVGDIVGADGSFRVLVRSPVISSGDKLVTTQLPRAMTGLLVEPIQSSGFETAKANDGAPPGS